MHRQRLLATAILAQLLGLLLLSAPAHAWPLFDCIPQPDSSMCLVASGNG